MLVGFAIIMGINTAVGSIRGPADWHPPRQRSPQNPEIPTTLFSTANRETVRRNVVEHERPCDMEMVAEVRTYSSRS
jgi:hypothetical protein